MPELTGLRPRLLAWQVLQDVARGAYADGALERALQRPERSSDNAAPLGPADRALLTELAYGTIRQRGLLDGWLDQLGRVPASQQPPRLRSVLQLGAYQLLFCNGIPAAAAVNTSVELTRAVGLDRLAAVVNGMLRELCRRHAGGPEPWTGLVLPAQPAAALALRRSLPAWLGESLLLWLPPQQAELVAAACNTTPRLDLRINRLRSSRNRLQVVLNGAAIATAPIADLELGLTIEGRCGELRQLPGYGEGHWSVQDRSAQLVVPLLDPQPGMMILDACAAPGGKATQIAELCDDRVTIWAVDRAEARLRRLARNAERLGLESIRILCADACALPQLRPEWLESFDRILLDAPCSGLGTLARHADARWRLEQETITELVLLQQRLLDALALLLRPGGLLVYATCTMHPQENQDQVQGFLRRHRGWTLRQSWQRWPGDGDGFYAAQIQRDLGLPASGL